MQKIFSLAITILLLVTLTSCIYSADPDPEIPVVLESGQTMEFRVDGAESVLGRTIVNIGSAYIPFYHPTKALYRWYIDDEVVQETYDQNYFFDSSTVDIGLHTLKVSCGYYDFDAFIGAYYFKPVESRSWKVIADAAIESTPLSDAVLLQPVVFQEFIITAYPEGEDVVYEWYLDGELDGSVTGNTFVFSCEEITGHTLTANVLIKTHTFTRTWRVYCSNNIFDIRSYQEGFDFAETVSTTSSGEFIVAGYSYPEDVDPLGDSDYYILKLDADLGIIWQKKIGGSSNERAYGVVPMLDGGCIVAGHSESADIPGVTLMGDRDIYLIRLDSSGDAIWQRMYGGSDGESFYALSQSDDDGVVVAGYSNSTDIPGVASYAGDMYLFKIDLNGDIIWQKRNELGNLVDSIRDISPTTDGGFIVAGEVRYSSVNFIKLDSTGNLIWHKVYEGYHLEHVYSISQTADSGFIVAGSARPAPGVPEDIHILKLDSTGEIVWDKLYGGSSGQKAHSIFQTSDGGYVLSAETTSTDILNISPVENDLYVMKIDETGKIKWENIYNTGDPNHRWNSFNETKAMHQIDDNNYIVATGINCTIVRFSIDGEIP